MVANRPFRLQGPAVRDSMILQGSSEGPVMANFQPKSSMDGNDDDLDNTNSIDHGVTKAPYEHRFSPYDFNGGTVAAIAGPDYVVVAGDTRLSTGYEIISRNVTKLHAVTSKCTLLSSGCKTDVDQLRSVLDIRMKVNNEKKLMYYCYLFEKSTIAFFLLSFVFAYWSFN